MAGVGRVFQGVEYPSRREACQARHREYVRALADGLNVTQAAHAVGVSKRTGKVWRNGRTRSSGRCERASIAPQAHWYRLYMKCQPHRVSKRFLSLKERMRIVGWGVEGFSIRGIARRLGRSPSTVSRELKRIGRASNRGWCQGESAAGAANLLGPLARRAGGPKASPHGRPLAPPSGCRPAGATPRSGSCICPTGRAASCRRTRARRRRGRRQSCCRSTP